MLRTRWQYQLISILLFSLVWGVIGFFRPLIFEKLERQVFDWHYSRVEHSKLDVDIVLVLAGEETLSRFGEWPWPRRYHAKLLGQLGYARLIIFDVLFPEESTPEDDQVLAEIVKKLGNVIIAMHLSLGQTGGSAKIVPPYPALLQSSAGMGFTNVEPDLDGLIRFATPVRKADDIMVPSLSLAAVSSLRQVLPQMRDFGQRFYLALGEDQLPVDSKGRLWIHFSKQPMQTYEYYGVMSAQIPPETFKDKVIVVGVAAAGVEDYYVVPLPNGNQVITGAQLNAEILKTLLGGKVPVRISPVLDGLIAAIFGAVGVIIALSIRSLRSFALMAGVLVTFSGFNHLLFLKTLYWSSFLIPATGMTLAFLFNWLVRFSYLQRDWEVKTFSISSIYSLAQNSNKPVEKFENYLESLWPNVEKNTGIKLISSRIFLEHALKQQNIDPNASSGLARDNIIMWEDRHKNPRYKMLIPINDAHTQDDSGYTLLAWNNRRSKEVLRTISAMVISISWFFRLLHQARERKKLLMDTIQAIFTAVDFKDPITGGHSNRVSEITLEILKHLKVDPQIAEDIHLGALIHDIGKIGIPDTVLKSKDKLSDEQYSIIKEHPGIGAKIMRSVGLPETTFKALYEHHERQDGKGYPRGLKGDEISLAGQIVAVADQFDALTSERPYRKGMSVNEVCDYLYERSGTEFDAKIVEMVLQIKAPRDWKPKQRHSNQ